MSPSKLFITLGVKDGYICIHTNEQFNVDETDIRAEEAAMLTLLSYTTTVSIYVDKYSYQSDLFLMKVRVNDP